MVATVLNTTKGGGTIFLEEPESHLHPGAQRFLIGKVYGIDRQVFITTHSPVFVNMAGHGKSLYQVARAKGKTIVKCLKDTESLGEMLEDIGARNSDVLLSDAVLFVEGPGDKGTFQVWARTLGTPLDEHNVTVLPMGGGEHAERSAPVRSDVLEGISKKAPIPHRFLIDRDERRPDEIERLQVKLETALPYLTRENWRTTCSSHARCELRSRRNAGKKPTWSRPSIRRQTRR
jgi:putative ATP-dependent endonuclease of OLD family